MVHPTGGTVTIADIPVLAVGSSQVVKRIATRGSDKASAFALHVGGLNHLQKSFTFRDAMKSADFVYADGAAVVALARLAGAHQIERAATTDIGAKVVEAEQERLGRPARLALVGGKPGLAERASETLAAETGAATVFVTHGFHEDYTSVLAALKSARPDVIFVGLGMPAEAEWVNHHWDRLPDALIMTCGGWFGFLAGHEQRAPQWLQRFGLEWTFRLRQSPRRLLRRYVEGFLTSVKLASRLFLRRRQAPR